MNGGYLMVSKTDTKLYEKLNNALTIGKPVLWYEDENTCYYIDTITKSGTDIILTKGGKTITIESDGDITESGDIQVADKHLYKHTIKTSDGIVLKTLYTTDSQAYDENGFGKNMALNTWHLSESTNEGPGQFYGYIYKFTNMGDDYFLSLAKTFNYGTSSFSYSDTTISSFTDIVTQIF